MKAQVVPYSSIVGQSIMLMDEKGAVIAQLSLLNIQPAGLEGEARKAKAQERFSDWVAIKGNHNGGDPIGHGATEQEAIDNLLDQLEERL